MAQEQAPLVGDYPRGFGTTVRTDRWWVAPAFTVLALSGFLVYATWAAFQGVHYYASPYLSPFYSPVLFTDVTAPGSVPVWHALFGAWPEWWPSFIKASPALFILPFPGAFRFTCYYYRKAYYRGFAGSPPACGVGPRIRKPGEYHGETRLLILQNLHRYALYLALPYIPILYADAGFAFFKDGQFGIGVGTVVLLINATLLAGYTLGCHSFRHLIGGNDDCLSCGKNTVKFRAWKSVTRLNVRHMNFAWASLFWVAFTDLYVRLVSMGVLLDLNTWN